LTAKEGRHRIALEPWFPDLRVRLQEAGLLDNEVVAGLDLGSTKVCCVAAKLDDGGEPTIVGIGVSPSRGIRRGVVTDIDATSRAIEDAVSKASSQAGCEILSVYVGVSGEHVQCMNSRGVAAITRADQEITAEDRDRVLDQSKVILIPNERTILHAIPRVYSIDGQEGIRQPVGMCGSRLEVETHIVTGARTFLLNVDKCVARAQLRLDQMVLASLATGGAILTREERELGVGLLDIGGGCTDVAAFTDGEICHASVKPVGANHVTNDIAQVLKVTAQDAERLKLEHGNAVASLVGANDAVPVKQIGWTEARPLRQRALCEIIEARMQELFALVKKEFDQSEARGRLTAGVVLTGGGAELAGAVQCAGDVLNMPVRLGGPRGIGRLASSGGSQQTGGSVSRPSPAGPEFDSPAYAAAVGLVRWAAVQEAAAEAGGAPVLQAIKDWLGSLWPRR